MSAVVVPPPAEGGPLLVSAFRSAHDRWPRPRAKTWSQLVADLSRFTVYDRLPWVCASKAKPACKGTRPPGPHAPCPLCDHEMALDKTSLPAWSPARFRDRTPRAKSNVVDVWALVLDHDDGEDLDAISARWASWPHLLHTSWSHTDEKPKARLVLPFGEPVSAARWPRVWAWACERDPRIDRKCSDASRLFFLPALRAPDWPHRVIVHDEPEAFLTLSDRELPRLEAPRPRRPADPLCSPRGADRARRFALKHDPDVRRQVGLDLGGTVRGTGPDARVVGVPCPGCARPSVWWFLEPDRKVRAECDHRNSCGWTGWLDQLSPENAPPTA